MGIHGYAGYLFTQPLALPVLPPIPLDAMGLAIQAAGRRGDELLGPALRQMDAAGSASGSPSA